MRLLPILAATAASYVLGSLWYLALGRRWRIAVGLLDGITPYRPRPAELATALAGQLVLATALATLFAHAGVVSHAAGLAAATAVWAGFIMPTLSTNVVFQRRPAALLWMDGGHWLLILAVQGSILG